MAGRIWAAAKRLAGGFAAATKGATLPMMAAGLIPAIAALGTAIDLSRIYMAKTQLQAGVDAAALAGARAFAITDDSSQSRDSQADAYFVENFADSYLGSRNLDLDKDFSVNAGVNVTLVTAQIDLPMAFMQIFGQGDRHIVATARAELQPRPLEVMVVLDNTGSMASGLDKGTRMSALKTAAKSFVNILYQGSENRSELALGFTLYTVTTNVGSVLAKYGVSVETVDGFSNVSYPTSNLGWKGCVSSDPTLQDLDSKSASQIAASAYDVQKTLPGENGMPSIKPMLIPPVWIPTAGTKEKPQDPSVPGNLYYSSADGNSSDGKFKPSNYSNLFQLGDSFVDSADNLANKPAYRKFFREYYIGLNSNGAANSNDDVIVKNDTARSTANTTWYNAATDGDNYYVRYDRIPQKEIWRPSVKYTIKPAGDTIHPTPNWQCPEHALEVAYGRTKTSYINYIDQQNGYVRPANGTMHHIGLVWGWRLLSRDDVFKRTNPTTEQPRRAIVFMTDGNTEYTTSASYLNRYFTAYGTIADKKLTATATNAKFKSAAEDRFARTCAAIHAEQIDTPVYVVALALDSGSTNTRTMFRNCAPGRFYDTASTAELKTAFDAIATELVDLHLTQ